MRHKFRTVIGGALLAVGLVAAGNANASVVMSGTRIIYSAQEHEVTVKLTNDGKVPAVTQVWIDNGDPDADPATIAVPFTVTPPMARIDPGKTQTLRILYTGQPLAQDKESVFWLNLLEIPPKPGKELADTNTLSLAFRSRFKLFYRPSSLKGEAADAPARLTWRVVRDGKSAVVEASNPTPYFVSISELELGAVGQSAAKADGAMVGPGETTRFKLTGSIPSGSDTAVRYHAINDWGGEIEGSTAIQAPQ
ncbi:fimbria/pilus periplasmic chaperone [Cupriavidus metallidurans]|nr:fimbria/pilus periplasmic chaperone [Cupriavidus metallidurans]UBM09479.1 fimbria/pilus periplasmic chaperone [Cupriavidus metallidurans]